MRTACVLVLLLVSARLSAADWQFWTLAGTRTGGGAADGPAREARFASPSNAAICGETIFVADAGNHAIRRLSADGQVTTWAGALTQAGSNDGDRESARFQLPSGIAADAQCNLFVADRGNHTIRRISSAGVVTTIAGRAGTAGNADGSAADARFNEPQDLAVDTDGVLWIADTGNNKVRLLGNDGKVKTISTRTFNRPMGIAVDSSGVAFVADYGTRAVVRVTRDGAFSTAVTGSSFYPSDVAFDGSGALHAVTYVEQILQRIEPSRTLTTIAGTASRSGERDGTGGDARFDHPRGIVFDPVTNSFVIVDELSGVVRRVTNAAVVTTIGGTAAAESANVDGLSRQARFVTGADVEVDPNGIGYVADLTTVRRVTRDGTTTTLSGNPNEALHRDGPREVARFRTVSRLALEPSGSLVVIDGDTVRRVTLDGSVITIAGSPTASGFKDDAGAAARFNYLVSIAVAPNGTIYVADAFNRAIRRIVGDAVTTLASGPDFDPPMGGMDVDAGGNVFLWNENVPSVFRVTPEGTVTKVVSDPSLNTLVNGLALAPDGTIYLGGLRRHTIYRVAPGSTQIERFAGDDVATGNQGGPPALARFRSPTSLDVGPDGRLFVCDGNRAIRVGTQGAPASILSFTATPAVIKQGESAVLTWSIGSGSGRIEPGLGHVAAAGSLTVTPSATTTYSLIATNELGDARQDVTVVRTGPRRRSVRP